MLNYLLVGAAAVAAILVVVHLVRLRFRPPCPIGGVVAARGDAAPVQQQKAGEERVCWTNKIGRGSVGFIFFAAAAASFPLAYFLPFPYNGMAFMVAANAAFFLKLRYRSDGIESWSGVSEWLTYRGDQGHRRFSGFFVAEAFALAFFEAFFRYMVPQYPGLVLAFFLAIVCFIVLRLAEGIIDIIARRFSWMLVVGLVGACVIVWLHVLFFEHIERRMISVAFLALVMGGIGWYLRACKAQDADRAGLGFLAVSCVALLAVAANFVSILDNPAKKFIDAARAYQNGRDVEFDGRILPPTKQKPQSEKPPQPPPTTPAAAEQKPAASAETREPQEPIVVRLTQPPALPQVPAIPPQTPAVAQEKQEKSASSEVGQPQEAEWRRIAGNVPPPAEQPVRQEQYAERERIPERIYPPRLEYVFTLAEDPPARQELPPAKKSRWSVFCPRPTSRADEIFK